MAEERRDKKEQPVSGTGLMEYVVLIVIALLVGVTIVRHLGLHTVGVFSQVNSGFAQH